MNSPQTLISRLKDHDVCFVVQIDTISKEIQRAVILQQEQWLEYMDEAIKYFKDGEYKTMIQIMADLYKRMDLDPQSHN